MKAKLQSSPKHIYQRIKQHTSPPLQALQVPPAQPGLPRGPYTADPREIDKIIRAAWDPIYNGNVAHFEALVDHFFHKYSAHIYRAAPNQIPPFNWIDLKHVCLHGPATAAGLDGWHKLDLSWASDLAFQWLGRLFQNIEDTQQWPSEMAAARGVSSARTPPTWGIPWPTVS